MAIVRIVKSHPLLTVILVAAILRLPAVFFSKGYMANDDHFETVMVADNWLHQGFYSDSGYLLWARSSPRSINRFPLYTFSLWSIMKGSQLLGAESLDSMMYVVRLMHALLSLISVWMAYRIIELVTGSPRWALIAGLVIAGHGLMPFLSVRTLIEVVSGHCLVAAFYFLYRYRFERQDKLLLLAGLLSGLALLIRLPVAAALLPIPFMLWWSERRFWPGFQYCVGVLLMALAAGVTDYFVVGTFGQTMINQFLAGHEKLYNVIPFIYPVVIFAFFIPPLSALAIYLTASRSIWREHHLLILSLLSFMLIHSFIPNRQERFMIPIVPLLTVLFVLAFWYHKQENGFFFRMKRLRRSVIAVSLAINLSVLAVYTLNYSHRGLVEPLVILQKITPAPGIIFVAPEGKERYPVYYAGHNLPRQTNVKRWTDLDNFVALKEHDEYLIIYPPRAEDLPRFVDSLEKKVGSIVQQHYVSPSTIDFVLNFLNPRYNPTREAWIYRLENEG